LLTKAPLQGPLLFGRRWPLMLRARTEMRSDVSQAYQS